MQVTVGIFIGDISVFELEGLYIFNWNRSGSGKVTLIDGKWPRPVN